MILDTNALSAFFDGTENAISIINQQQAIHLPVMVLGEYRFGLKGSKLRKSIEPQLEAFINTCEVLAVMESTAKFYASIRHQLRTKDSPIPENDVWISALAAEYNLAVLTNDKHFDEVDSLQRISY